MDYLTRHGQRMIEMVNTLDTLRGRFNITHSGYRILAMRIDAEAGDMAIGRNDLAALPYVVWHGFIANELTCADCGHYFATLEDALDYYYLGDRDNELRLEGDEHPQPKPAYPQDNVWLSMEWRSKGFN